MQYRYFVSYCYKSSENMQGFGNGTVVLNKKIKNNKDVASLTNFFKNSKHEDVVILGITLLEVEENVNNIN